MVKEQEVDGEIIRHNAFSDVEERYRQRYADLYRKYANLYGEGKLRHNRELNGGKLFMDTQIVKCLSVKCGTQFTGLCNLCEKTGEEFD